MEFWNSLIWSLGECLFVRAKVLQSCLTLCDPMDSSPPGSSVHGIFQAKIQKWVAIPISRGLSQLRDRTHEKENTENDNSDSDQCFRKSLVNRV